MKDLAFLLKGRIRQKVLKSLHEKPKTSTMISKEIDGHRASVSRALLDLNKAGFVMCENPNDDKFRLYSLTNKGKTTLTELKKYD